MRDIKFRVWHKKENRWLDPWAEEDPILSLKDYGKGCEVFLYDRKSKEHSNINCQMDDVVIQQYTGLKDKNGVEIYEGDILGYPESLDDKTLSEVRWAKAYSGYQWCEFRIQDINGNNIQDAQPHDYYGGISQNDYRIVVGNIFEGAEK